jgi:putative tryptophan/tyrosine transport system substrate-binding protein
MRRRDFITLVGGTALGWPLSTGAQPTRVPRVGVLAPAQSDSTPIFKGLRKGPRDLGYIQGQTIVLEFRFAKGILDAFPGLAAELVRLPVDLIVTDGNSAAKAALMRHARYLSSWALRPMHLRRVSSKAMPGPEATSRE